MHLGLLRRGGAPVHARHVEHVRTRGHAALQLRELLRLHLQGAMGRLAMGSVAMGSVAMLSGAIAMVRVSVAV